MNDHHEREVDRLTPYLVGNHRAVITCVDGEWVVRKWQLHYLKHEDIEVGDLLVCNRERDGTMVLCPVTTLLRPLEA